MTLHPLNLDTFDGAKPRFLNRGKKRRAVSTLSPSAVLGALSLSKGVPRVFVLSAVEGSDRGVEWVDSERNKVMMSRDIACTLSYSDHKRLLNLTNI